jgi:hypothetical protein
MLCHHEAIVDVDNLFFAGYRIQRDSFGCNCRVSDYTWGYFEPASAAKLRLRF